MLLQYVLTVLKPFVEERVMVVDKIKNTTDNAKRKYYKKKYRYMKVSLIPIFGYIFKIIYRKYARGDYLDD